MKLKKNNFEEHETTDLETRPLIRNGGLNTETYVYKRRWWILAVFSLSATTQAMVWNTWGPIAESLQVVYGWSDGLLALLPNLGNISYLTTVIPATLIMDAKGIRLSMIFCSILLIICSGIRCVSSDEHIFTPLAYTSAFIQGITATVPFAAPPLISAIWFPVEERPTATAIGSFFNYFGVSVSFVIGPQLVPGPVYVFSDGNRSDAMDSPLNATVETAYVWSSELHNTSVLADEPSTKTLSNLDDLKSGIFNLMYVHTAVTVLLFIFVLAYFPDRPPKPPSITASIQRTNYRQALQTILKNGPLWLICIAGTLPIAFSGSWIAIIDVIVKAIGVSQVDAGWMGFLNTLIGCLFGIVIAKYSSLFHRRRKIYLSALFVCAGISVIWFSLVSDSVLPYSLPSLYVACILIGIFINGTMPLFYEMAAEAAYPVGEGLAGGFFTCIHDCFGTIFLAMVSIPNIGITWLNWTILGAICLSIPMLLFFPEKYKRSDIDMQIDILK